MVEYLGVQIEPCGREMGESPDSYYFFPKGDADTEYPYERGSGPYLRETGLAGTCGMKWANIKLCSTCLRKLGVLW